MRTAPLALLLSLGLVGCSADHLTDDAGQSDRPAALVDGRPLSWDRLTPSLIELAGGEALEEAVLDDLLERRCAQQHLAVGPDQIATERALLIESLDPSQDHAEELLRIIRTNRRMGEYRFNAALRRSAMLRALVGVNAVEENAELAVALKVRAGERAVVRIITSLNETDAAAARARVTASSTAGQPIDPMRFATVAAELSQDDARLRGGLVGEISAADTTLPAALRDTIARTPVGSITPTVATGKAFVIALVQDRLPARGEPTPQERAALAHDARVAVQRRAMERLAQAVLTEARIEPLDRSLGWSWDQRRK